MSKASMLSHYNSFRRNHTTHALYSMGKKDELFDWQTSPGIFKGCTGIEYVYIEDETHFDILGKSTKFILTWINASGDAER